MDVSKWRRVWCLITFGARMHGWVKPQGQIYPRQLTQLIWRPTILPQVGLLKSKHETLIVTVSRKRHPKPKETTALFIWARWSHPAHVLIPVQSPTPPFILNRTTSLSCFNSSPLNLTQSVEKLRDVGALFFYLNDSLVPGAAVRHRRKGPYLWERRVEEAERICPPSWQAFAVTAWAGDCPRCTPLWSR